jgi:hypothetical protein
LTVGVEAIGGICPPGQTAVTLSRGFSVLTPSTPFAYPQVGSRTFALFRGVKFRVYAGQEGF